MGMDIPLHESCGAYHEPSSTSCLGAVMAQRDRANTRLAQARELLRAWDGLACESSGVAGWHLNGAVAEWNEFDCYRDTPPFLGSEARP